MQEKQPQAVDVERSVLGASVVDSVVMRTCIDLLDTDSFSLKVHKIIFQAIQDMAKDGVPVDMVTLPEYLDLEGDLEDVGGVGYIAELQNSVSTLQNIESYCRILLEKSARRTSIRLAQGVIASAHNEEVPLENTVSMLGELHGKLGDFVEGRVLGRLGKTVKAGDLAESMNSYYEEEKKIMPGVYPGWRNLAEIYRPALGVHTVITGIPHAGKSELADALMVNLAHYEHWKWLVFSPENYPVETHVRKIMEKFIGRSMHGENRMTPSEKDSAIEWMDKHFRFICMDDENVTLEKIILIARDGIKNDGINAILVDPWNDIVKDMAPREMETEWVLRKLIKIRYFIRRNMVHWMTVVHPVKMEKEKKGKDSKYRVPTLYDCAGSANFFNKADNGLCIYRDFVANISNIHVQKVKQKSHGHVGVVQLKYDPISGRFSEPDAAVV